MMLNATLARSPDIIPLFIVIRIFLDEKQGVPTKESDPATPIYSSSEVQLPS
jgi:hypothetical protein